MRTELLSFALAVSSLSPSTPPLSAEPMEDQIDCERSCDRQLVKHQLKCLNELKDEEERRLCISGSRSVWEKCLKSCAQSSAPEVCE